jgi:hypothetical protein
MGLRAAQDRRLYRTVAEIQDSPLGRAEALQRLTVDSHDAHALITIYEHHRVDFKVAATRWFGRSRELRKRALNEILVAVAQRAQTFDPGCMDAADWIKKCACAQAQRLYETFNRRSNEIGG